MVTSSRRAFLGGLGTSVMAAGFGTTLARGGFAFGGLAAGLVASQGALHLSLLSLNEWVASSVTLLGWLISTVGATIGGAAAV